MANEQFGQGNPAMVSLDPGNKKKGNNVWARHGGKGPAGRGGSRRNKKKRGGKVHLTRCEAQGKGNRLLVV